MFYYNPDDNNFLVNARIGINMTMNLAKPAGKAIMIFAVLMVAAMPFFGVWVWAEEVTPARLILTQNELIARHTTNRYVIALDSIDSVVLLDSLPGSTRVSGSGLDHLLKGTFRVLGYGNSSLNVHQNEPPFLLVTAGGRYFFINDADANVTREVYLRLRR